MACLAVVEVVGVLLRSNASNSNEPVAPLIFVQLILVEVEAFVLVVIEWINKARMVTKTRLGLEALNGCMGSFGRTVSADQLNAFLSTGKDVQVLNDENATHDA